MLPNHVPSHQENLKVRRNLVKHWHWPNTNMAADRRLSWWVMTMQVLNMPHDESPWWPRLITMAQEELSWCTRWRCIPWKDELLPVGAEDCNCKLVPRSTLLNISLDFGCGCKWNRAVNRHGALRGPTRHLLVHKYHLRCSHMLIIWNEDAMLVYDHMWWSYMLSIYDGNTETYMWSMYGHLIWSLHVMAMWGDLEILKYENHLWWSHMVMIHDDHIRWSHMIIPHGHHRWPAYAIIVYDDHGCCKKSSSYMVITHND